MVEAVFVPRIVRAMEIVRSAVLQLSDKAVFIGEGPVPKVAPLFPYLQSPGVCGASIQFSGAGEVATGAGGGEGLAAGVGLGAGVGSGAGGMQAARPSVSAAAAAKCP